ncbi:helix-turn-helix domain-containing protein [Kineococcus sp. NUM-3379]
MPQSQAPGSDVSVMTAGAPPGRSPLDDDVLTVLEVAALFKVSRQSVYDWIHQGHLPAIRLGRTFRIHAQVVRQILASGTMAVGGADA